MGKEKQEETFRVVDRRLFSEDGQLRQDAIDQEEKERAATAAQQKATPPAQAAAGTGAPAAPVVAVAPPPPVDSPKASRHFRMLLGLLANQAEACLGGMPDPRTGQAFLDLEGARAIIDIFDDLTERTRGNLAPEDQQILLEIIGSLKVTYFEMEKAAAEMSADAAAGAAPPSRDAGPRAKR